MAVAGRTRSGWVTLSAVLILLAGGYNAVWGLGALNKKDLFNEMSLIYSNLAFWGWLFLIIGVFQVITAVLLFMRNPIGLVLAVLGATTSAFIAFFSLLATPGWSLAIIGLDVLILWTLFARYEDFE